MLMRPVSLVLQNIKPILSWANCLFAEPTTDSSTNTPNYIREAKVRLIKGQVQGLGWFLTRFPLKLAVHDDVGEIVIWGL